MALAHTCPDGTRSRLVRTGPVIVHSGRSGSKELERVRFECLNCGHQQTAAEIEQAAVPVLRALAADPRKHWPVDFEEGE